MFLGAFLSWFPFFRFGQFRYRKGIFRFSPALVKASAMTNLLMCCYVCGFLAALGRRLFNVFILYVNSFKNRSSSSGSIKYSRSVCCLSYHSSAGGLYKYRLCNLVLMFRFLWISAGPTYSALPVNAKDVSGDILSDGNY